MENDQLNENQIQQKQDFSEVWLPHYQMHDSWQFQGLLRDIVLPENQYFWCCSLNKFSSGGYSLYLSVSDLAAAVCFSERLTFGPGAQKKLGFSIDHDSIFVGDKVQILDTPRAMAVVLRQEEFNGSFCLVKNHQYAGYGNTQNSWSYLGAPGKQELTSIVLAQTATSCKLNLPEKQLKLVGRSVVERAFGPYNLRYGDGHWERFYIFFNNGAELMLLHLPRSKQIYGKYFPMGAEARNIAGATVQMTATTSVEEWRFGSTWSISVEDIPYQEFYLIPVIDAQYRLPCSRVVAGVFGHNGEKIGYCMAELLPGARSTQEKIPFALFRR